MAPARFRPLLLDCAPLHPAVPAKARFCSLIPHALPDPAGPERSPTLVGSEANGRTYTTLIISVHPCVGSYGAVRFGSRQRQSDNDAVDNRSPQMPIVCSAHTCSRPPESLLVPTGSSCSAHDRAGGRSFDAQDVQDVRACTQKQRSTRGPICLVPRHYLTARLVPGCSRQSQK